MKQETKILIVEDETITAMEIENSLIGAGYQVIGPVSSHQDALKMVRMERPGLILMDIKLKGESDGIQTAEAIRKIHDIPIIYLTAFSDISTLARAIDTNPYNFIAKPFNENDLKAAVMIALNNYNHARQVRENENWLTSVLNSMGEAIVTTDQNGRFRWMNTLAEDLTGYQQDEVDQIHIDQICQFLRMDQSEQMIYPCTDILRSDEKNLMHEKVLLRTSRMPETPVRIRGNPVLGPDESVIGCVLMFQVVKDGPSGPKESG